MSLISSSYSGDGDEGTPSSSVTSLCFFCFKTASTTQLFSSEYEEEDNSSNKITTRTTVKQFIRLLGRFLGEDQKLFLRDFVVNDKCLGCCKDCVVIVESFCELYHQLKLLEVKLEWKVETLMKVMKLANKVPSRVRNLRSIFEEKEVKQEPGETNCQNDTSETEDGQVTLKSFRSWRTALIKQCTQRLSKSQPRVLITRLNWEPSVSEVNFEELKVTPAPAFAATNFLLGWTLSFTAVALLAGTTVTDFGDTMLSEINDEPFSSPASCCPENEDSLRDATPRKKFFVESGKHDLMSEDAEEPSADSLETGLDQDEGAGDGENIVMAEEVKLNLSLVDVIGDDSDSALRENQAEPTQETEGTCEDEIIEPDNDSMSSQNSYFKDGQHVSLATTTDDVLDVSQNNDNDENSDSKTLLDVLQQEPLVSEALQSQEPVKTEGNNNSQYTGNISNDKRFHCKPCSTSYSVKRSLISHIRHHHTTAQGKYSAKKVSVKRFHCEACQYSCTGYALLFGHKRSKRHQILRKKYLNRLRKVKLEPGEQTSSLSPPKTKLDTPLETEITPEEHNPSRQLEEVTKEEMAEDHNNRNFDADASDNPASDNQTQEPESALAPVAEAGRYNLRGKRKRSYDITEDDGDLDDDNPSNNSDYSSNTEDEDDTSSSSSESDSEHVAKKPKRNAGDAKPKYLYCSLDDCNNRALKAAQYQQHQKLHDPGTYKCYFCEVLENSAMKLSTHEWKTHSEKEVGLDGKELFSCSRCPFVTTQFLTFAMHFAEKHLACFKRSRNVDVAECNVCYLQMAKSKLESHVNTCHDLTDVKEGQKIWNCQVEGCSAFFKRGNQRLRHQKKVHGMFPNFWEVETKEAEEEEELEDVNFICTHCNKSLETVSLLKIHKRKCPPKKRSKKKRKPTPKIQTKPETFACPVAKCPEKFKAPRDLENHRKLHGSFPCYFCDLVADYAPDLAIHEMTHVTRPRKTKYSCARCNFDIDKKFYFMQHHLKFHLGLGTSAPKTCPVCNAEGAHQRKFLPYHMNAFHNTEGLDPSQIFRCDQCPAYFIRGVQLATHLMSQHITGTTCSQCKKDYGTGPHLRAHIERLHPEMLACLKFVCEVTGCKKRFASKEELDSHRKIHGTEKDKRVKCPKCEKRFKARDLNRHLKRAHGNNKAFVCEECGKGFGQKCGYDLHMEYHKGPESWKFQCATCGKKCATRQKLEQHQRTHTKEKPFVCQFCGERYAHQHNLRGHVKTKHPESGEEGKEGVKKGEYLSRKGSKKGDCITSGAKA